LVYFMQNEKPADLSFACFQGEAWRVCQLSIYRYRGLLSIILYLLRPPYGDWKDYRDCHIRPDLILIYCTPDSSTLQLVRLGSHSELGL
jgi:hypothetical protein